MCHLFLCSRHDSFNVLLVVTGQVLRGHHQVFPGKNKAAHSARVFRLVKRLFKRAGRHLPRHVSGLVAVCKKENMTDSICRLGSVECESVSTTVMNLMLYWKGHFVV